MVVDEPAGSETVTALPHLTLHSMTQSQLKELIPQLVTRITGRTSPLFGSLGDKPDWWPCDLEWTSPEELADSYQDPCEKLREIVRSCYCFMDQDNLLNSSDLAEFSSELPVSPAVGDTDVCASCPDSEPLADNQVARVDTDVTEDLDKKLDEPDSGMTIQSKARPSEDIDKCSKSTEKMKKPGEETVMPSEHSKLDSYGKLEHSKTKDDIGEGVTAAVAESDSVEDCEITGMSVNMAKDISADVIAQIDFEIAKSLKAAFLNVGNFGLTNVGQKECSRDTSSPMNLDRLLGLDKNFQPLKKVKKRRSSTEEEKQKPYTVGRFPETSKLESQPTVNDKLTKKNTTGSINFSPGSKESGDAIKTECEELPDIVKEEKKEEKHEDDVVWICFVCAKGFADQSELMKHQDICEDEPDKTDSVQLKSSHPVIGSQKGQTALPTSLSDSSLSETSHSQPVPTLLRKVGSNLKSLPLGLPNKSRLIRKRQRKFEDIYIPPSRDVYFESLELFPTPRVEAISKSPRKSVTDDDCQIIDLTMEDPQAVPMTPRTRSMLSQLSRDDSSGHRRQLSFSQNVLPSVSDKEKVDLKELSEDSESSDGEEVVQKQKVPSKSAILGIPLTSPLGQRLKKHWNYENKVPIVEDIEMFCKTDARSLLNLDRNKTKNPMVEKLRNRPPPQCTFRFTKKYMNRWSHWYKFNKADKREFEKRLMFGLDRDSRIKLKRMKKCKVVLARISKKDIKYWTTPRPKFVQKKFFPETTMLQQYNRQYRLHQIQNVMASSNAVRPMQQGALFNQLMQPARFAAPTPQLLVRTVPMGGQGMRLQVLPIQQTQNQNLFLSTQNNLVPGSPLEVARSQKRKQVFSNVREDDNMVICLSSDEEEEIIIKPQSKPKQSKCTMCSIYKGDCRVHGKRRIGPASFMRQQSNNSESTSSPKIDIKANPLASIIARTTVNTVQPVRYANTASARIFGPSVRPSSQSVEPRSNFTHMRISGGTTTVISNASGNVPVHQDASQTVQAKNETGSAENDKNENQSADSEYMDYEVICIDSDAEDE